MKLCILDAWGSDDKALVNSHWVAEHTAIALQNAFPTLILTTKSGYIVDKACVETELAAEHEGFAYFGHGQDTVLYRIKDGSNPVLREKDWPPIPIFEITHLPSVGQRWFHAFACLSGNALSKAAPQAGVGAYLGYSIKVVVEWEPNALPEDLRLLLENLITVATLLLARGERARGVIRKSVKNASDELLEWLDEHEENVRHIHWKDLTGLKMLAFGLHQSLELEGLDVLP